MRRTLYLSLLTNSKSIRTIFKRTELGELGVISIMIEGGREMSTILSLGLFDSVNGF